MKFDAYYKMFYMYVSKQSLIIMSFALDYILTL